jgi:hypothetical protein
MDRKAMSENILESKLEGRREVGRPKLKLLGDRENDLLELTVKRWRQKASNREEYVLMEARIS